MFAGVMGFVPHKFTSSCNKVCVCITITDCLPHEYITSEILFDIIPEYYEYKTSLAESLTRMMEIHDKVPCANAFKRDVTLHFSCLKTETLRYLETENRSNKHEHKVKFCWWREILLTGNSNKPVTLESNGKENKSWRWWRADNLPTSLSAVSNFRNIVSQPADLTPAPPLPAIQAHRYQGDIKQNLGLKQDLSCSFGSKSGHWNKGSVCARGAGHCCSLCCICTYAARPVCIFSPALLDSCLWGRWHGTTLFPTLTSRASACLRHRIRLSFFMEKKSPVPPYLWIWGCKLRDGVISRCVALDLPGQLSPGSDRAVRFCRRFGFN